MTDKGYLKKLNELHIAHHEKSLAIQNKICSIQEQLSQIFENDEEFVTVGLPFMKSSSKIINDYLELKELYPNIILLGDKEIDNMVAWLLALCQTWFEARDINQEWIDDGFPSEEFNKITNTLLQFLKDTNTDPDSLIYCEFIY